LKEGFMSMKIISKKKISFTTKYNCTNLIYYERFTAINQAINREIMLKKWRIEKKDALINGFYPDWNFLNENIKERFYEE